MICSRLLRHYWFNNVNMEICCHYVWTVCMCTLFTVYHYNFLFYVFFSTSKNSLCRSSYYIQSTHTIYNSVYFHTPMTSRNLFDSLLYYFATSYSAHSIDLFTQKYTRMKTIMSCATKAKQKKKCLMREALTVR